jgi:hypothetical protein
MPGSILAIATSDGVDGGAVLTFALPVALFVVITVLLYLRIGRPHKRVPERRILVAAHAAPPDAGSTRAAAVAAGMPTASGGGGAESGAEPAGAARDSAAAAEPSNVSDRGASPADAGDPDQDTSADGTEASE